MKITTPEANLGEDVDRVWTKEENPNWQIMNRCQALRKTVGEMQRELHMTHGASLDLQASQVQIQVMALIKWLCPTDEDRWAYEECYLSAMIEAVETVTAQMGRARLLGGVNQAQIQDILGKNGRPHGG